PQKLAQLDDLLMRMERVRPVIAGCETHPWRGCLIPDFTFEIQSNIRERFNTLRDRLRSLQNEARGLADACHLPAPISLQDVDRLLTIGGMARTTPQPPARWFEGANLSRLAAEAEQNKIRFQTYLERRQRLLARY